MLWANLSRAVLPAVLIAVIMLDLGSIWALYPSSHAPTAGSMPWNLRPTSSLVRRWAGCWWVWGWWPGWPFRRRCG